MSAEKKFIELGFRMPGTESAVGNFLPGVLHKGLLYMSGEGPRIDSKTMATGIVGKDLSVDEAYGHARLMGVALLSSVRRMLGSLDRVERVVSVNGMVNAVADFKDHPKVMNGFSDLMVEIFGESGRHARAAVGMGSLPGGMSVEVTAIFSVKD